MTVIGLTGGIASGRSLASSHAQQRGSCIIDADKLGHKVYEPNTNGFKKVVKAFGNKIVNTEGSIDRRKLGEKVFKNKSELKKLTDIVWPEIKSLAVSEIHNIQKQNSTTLIILEAAVLIEAEWFDIVDEVWVVTVEPETAINRTMNRDGLTRESAEARLASQISNAERKKFANVVLENSTTVAAFTARVDQELDRLLN